MVLVLRTQQNIVNCFQLFFDSLVNTFGFYIFSQNGGVKKTILSVLEAHHHVSLGGEGDVEGFWLCHERIYLIPSKAL